MSVPYTRISLRMEFIWWEHKLYFARQYMKNFGWSNSCTEAVLITDELHDKLISVASHVYDLYWIQIDSKSNVNTQISWFGACYV